MATAAPGATHAAARGLGSDPAQLVADDPTSADELLDRFVRSTDALTDLCARRGLRLIEDCAHAHGTSWRGRGVGSWGDFGSFSMQRSKLMTAGEGGVLICNDEELRDRAWAYADCGRGKGR